MSLPWLQPDEAGGSHTPRGLGAVALCGLVLLVVPVVAVLVRTPWTRVPSLLATEMVQSALILSLVAPAIATVVVVLVGTPLAWVLARRRLPAHRLVRAVVLLPMVLPPVVGGVALLASFGRGGVIGAWLHALTGVQLPFTTAAVVLAAVFVALPFHVVTLEAAFTTVDRRPETALATLGATPWRVLRLATLPATRTALLAGAGLAWARALGEFGATITFAGNLQGSTQTLPLAVYVVLQSDPEAATVVSLVLVAMSLTVLILLRGHWLTGITTSPARNVDPTAPTSTQPRVTRPEATRHDSPAPDATASDTAGPPSAATGATPHPTSGDAPSPATQLGVVSATNRATSTRPDATADTLTCAVRVSRGDFTVTADLTLPPGITVLVGPNGAGKSTLVHAMAGTLPRSQVQGTIRLGATTLDSPSVHVPMHSRHIGLLHQTPALLGHRSLLDNVALAAARCRRIRDHHRRTAEAELAAVGLASALNLHLPDQLSGGQQQRGALARTLASQPRALLLDEPLSAVDPQSATQLRHTLRTRLTDAGLAAVVVSHHVADVMALADQVVVVEDGNVTACGTVDELRHAPATPWIADLFGTNHITGTAHGTQVQVDSSQVVLHTATHRTGAVHVSWNPAAVALYDTEPIGSPRNTLPCVVTQVTVLADRVLVHLDAGIPMTAAVTPAAVDELDIRPNRRLVAVVKATELTVH